MGNTIRTISPEILDYAKFLNRKTPTERAQERLILGSLVMAKLTEPHLFYPFLTIGLILAALDRQINPDHLAGLEFVAGNAHALSVAEATKIANRLKRVGKRVGWLHGFYRELTPGSLTNVVVASEYCDVLLLGLESGQRARKIKGVSSIHSDRVRERAFARAGLADHIVRINTPPRSGVSPNRVYRQIIEAIRPNIYFGNSGQPPWLRNEFTLRAQSAGAEYLELDYIPSFSTTENQDLVKPHFSP